MRFGNSFQDDVSSDRVSAPTAKFSEIDPEVKSSCQPPVYDGLERFASIKQLQNFPATPCQNLTDCPTQTQLQLFMGYIIIIIIII